MDWRVKMFGEKICSLLPFGYTIASMFRKKLSNMEVDYSTRIAKSLDNLAMIKTLTEFEPRNKRILEVGTGVHGVDSLIFYTLGADSIYTFDHVLHLKKELMASAIKPLFGALDKISDTFHIEKQMMAHRLENIRTDGSTEDMLASCNIKYFRYPIKNAGLKPESIDLFFSESVLQRIPTENLNQIFACTSKLLNRTGISFHRLDCKDINSQERYYDSGLWPLYYLKYSDFVWNLMSTKKFNNQNRLRETEFIQLLEKYGLNTLYIESFRKKEDIERLHSFPLAKRFREIPVEEVAIQSSKIISTKAIVSNTTRKLVEDEWTAWYEK